MKFLTKFVDYNDPKSFGSRIREKRSYIIKDMICDVFEKKGSVNIIDIGGRKTYWNTIGEEFLTEKKCKITLLNLENIDCPNDSEIFKFQYGDACQIPFSDKFFHIAHSNSVIEHVGNMEDMLKFSKETQRIAKSYYVQTPNFWFPFEPHFMFPFFHWLPKPLRIKMIQNFNLGHIEKSNNLIDAIIKIESANLLTSKEIKNLFTDGKQIREKVFGITKSITAIRKEDENCNCS